LVLIFWEVDVDSAAPKYVYIKIVPQQKKNLKKDKALVALKYMKENDETRGKKVNNGARGQGDWKIFEGARKENLERGWGAAAQKRTDIKKQGLALAQSTPFLCQ
jgi:hypothetical protein